MQSGQNQQIATACPGHWEVPAWTACSFGEASIQLASTEGLHAPSKWTISCRSGEAGLLPTSRGEAGVHRSCGREKTLPPWPFHYKKGLKSWGGASPFWQPDGREPTHRLPAGEGKTGWPEARYAGVGLLTQKAQRQQTLGQSLAPESRWVEFILLN